MATSPSPVEAAIAFLTDPQVASQPLSQKVTFLESKGLSAGDIQDILAKVNGRGPPQRPTAMALGPAPRVPGPLPPAYDWKDYLIMSTTTLGFLYGAYHVVSNHILPSILPPSKTKLDEDKESMDREFDRVEAVLAKLEADQREFIDSQKAKSCAIDDALVQLNALITDTTERNLRNDETLKYLKLEMESVKTTLLKSLEAQKDTIASELQDLSKMTRNIKEELDSPGSIPPAVTAPQEYPSPPANLITNRSFESSRSNSDTNSNTNSRFSVNVPPPASLPSAKDILKDDYAKPKPVPKEAGIPAWQLAAEASSGSNPH